MTNTIRSRKKFSLLSIIFAAISLAAYIISRALAFPVMSKNAQMQTMFFRTVGDGLWLYILLFVLPILAIVSCRIAFPKSATTVLKVISIIYLCIQILASVLNCIFLFSGISSFYNALFCSAAGRELITAFVMFIQSPGLRSVIMIIGELCALAATLMCAIVFSKKCMRQKSK